MELVNIFLKFQIIPASINVNLSNVFFYFKGTKVGDPEECSTLDRVFCKNRKDSLLIGTVKSNMGHCEASSGICSVTKALLAFESGVIPPNLHFKNPRKDIPALIEGRLKVCTELTPIPGNLIAVNSFGFGGANGTISSYFTTKIYINHI